MLFEKERNNIFKNIMKIYFHTFGCKVNQYETQLLREQSEFFKHKPVDDFTCADLCVINSCTVTHNADADCRQIVRKIMKSNPGSKIIVTGCYAAGSMSDIRNISSALLILPLKEDVVRFLKNGVSRPGEPGTTTYFHKHKKAFVKIQDGCDDFCSYCIVPYVRNRLWSKPAPDIFSEIKSLAGNGYDEIVICGIRLGRYEGGKNYGLAELLDDIAKKFRNIKFELSSIEVNEVTRKLLEIILNNHNITRHLHIPLQSGDDEILGLMNRKYSTQDYLGKVMLVREMLPGINLTTDLIVGFPGEDEKKFLNTYNFVRSINFDKIHIFRYSPRKGTASCEIGGNVRPADAKNRYKIINGLNSSKKA